MSGSEEPRSPPVDPEKDAAVPGPDADTLSAASQKIRVFPTKPHHTHIVFSQSLVTPEVLAYPYHGSGTEEDPYSVEFIPDDPRNPMTFSETKKWAFVLLMAAATFGVAFSSSSYSGGVIQIIEQFHISQEVAILGVSLFVLGFALGPLLWAPLSELYGRQITFFVSYGFLSIFMAGAAGAKNPETLIILRFLAGALGSSPLTNSGGVIADMFASRERGVAMAIFAVAPFLGPSLGPVIGGFVGQNAGWRWVQGITGLFCGVMWITCSLLVPETYAPVLLRRRAAALSKATGKVYRSCLEVGKGARPVSASHAFRNSLMRPWQLLFTEPIVLLLTIYTAIIYGTLYMCFAAFPIVYQQTRGWSEGIGGLAFMGVAVGFMSAVGYILWDNKRYSKVEDEAHAKGEIMAPPEARLPPTIIGAFLIPIGMFWFAWTNSPSIHWIVSIIGTVPFGFGLVLVFIGIMNYLIDSYTIYAASVLAANSVLRSLFGAAFPLFTSYMYQDLGIHWASSIPAFLALACIPFPLLFYKYGPAIRERCRYAREAMDVMRRIKQSEHVDVEGHDTYTEKDRRASEELRRQREAEEEEGRDTVSPDLALAQTATVASRMSARRQISRVPTRPPNEDNELERARSYQSAF